MALSTGGLACTGVCAQRGVVVTSELGSGCRVHILHGDWDELPSFAEPQDMHLKNGSKHSTRLAGQCGGVCK